MSDFIVGVTGGIGSGKSTVADAFVGLGAGLVDTDVIARELTMANGAAMPALVAEFGPEIVGKDGAMDRSAVRQRVFADPSARERLEAILHPLIRQISTERCLAATEPYVILAVPLLVESGNYNERCDWIVVIERNGLSVDEVKAIMAAQATRQQRLFAANDVVVNDGLRTKIYEQVNALHLKYLALAGEKLKASC